MSRLAENFQSFVTVQLCVDVVASATFRRNPSLRCLPMLTGEKPAGFIRIPGVGIRMDIRGAPRRLQLIHAAYCLTYSR
jgi:hypothetical protein